MKRVRQQSARITEEGRVQARGMFDHIQTCTYIQVEQMLRSDLFLGFSILMW